MKKTIFLLILSPLLLLFGCDKYTIIDYSLHIVVYIDNISCHDVIIGGTEIGRGEKKQIYSGYSESSSNIPMNDTNFLDLEYGYSSRIKFVYDDTLTIWHTKIQDTISEKTTTIPGRNNFFEDESWGMSRDAETHTYTYYYIVYDRDYATAQKLSQNSDAR